jgi:hypothetical protein
MAAHIQAKPRPPPRRITIESTTLVPSRLAPSPSTYTFKKTNNIKKTSKHQENSNCTVSTHCGVIHRMPCPRDIAVTKSQ